MGAGENARAIDIRNAFALGSAIADEGWIVLTGGRNRGVMDAVNKGAKASGGLTVGILPTKDRRTISGAVDVAIITDMGSARNNINVLTSDVIVACGVGGAGTASEIALALKSNKFVVLFNSSKESRAALLPHRRGNIEDYFLKSSGTLPPFSASLIITCLCSQIFIAAESFVSPG
jgi:uncharacterized protein (TIGR00725 family)